MGDIGSEVGQKGAVRLRRPERRQLAMVVQCADDLVRALHPVRTVMALVEKLDVSGFCEPIRAREGIAGRDATDPRLLVGLWLYGCVRGIGSARELARRCEESAPFRWMCGGVSVNHHLLSDFRCDHADALDALFTQVLVTLVDKKLVRVSRISQDGVRIRVSAGSREDVVQAHEQEVELFVPPKPARNPQNRGHELKPKPNDSEAIRAWKQRMESDEGKKIYRQRAATSETVNAELRTYRGLTPLTVRGLNKIKCVALWCALAYNLTHFSKALLS